MRRIVIALIIGASLVATGLFTTIQTAAIGVQGGTFMNNAVLRSIKQSHDAPTSPRLIRGVRDLMALSIP